MRAAPGVFWLLWLLAVHACARTPVWIDTDPSIGAPWREVDDAYALLLAFHLPELEIAGLSSSYGNASLPRTTAVAQTLVRQFGAAKMFAGAPGPREFARKTEASDALAAALRQRRLTYIALGPLTNLAAFLQQHPELRGRIERVIFVGGQSSADALLFGRSGWLRIHDANVVKDPAAVRAVLQSRLPLTLVPVETARGLQITRADFRALQRGGAPGEFLARRSGVWLWFWTRILGERGGPIFDALAILLAARPEFVETRARYAVMDDALQVTRANAPGRRRVSFCTGLRAEAQPFVVRSLLRAP